jgi:hypothetical protein
MYLLLYVEILIIVLRFVLILAVVLPFTVIFCSIPILIALGLFSLLVFTLSPLMLGYPISMIIDKRKKCIAYILLIIFYPLVGSIFTFIFFIIIMLYPLLR